MCIDKCVGILSYYYYYTKEVSHAKLLMEFEIEFKIEMKLCKFSLFKRVFVGKE